MVIVEASLMESIQHVPVVKGANHQSSVGVPVERTSRLVLLAKMEDAALALAEFSAKLNSIVTPLRQSFTYDQGKN
jgi:transposase, IS30 family